jgi:hypothetical protein
MQSGINESFKRLAEEKLPGLVQTLESCMNFEKWGFEQSFYGLAEEFAPSVIYDSNKCRVRFAWLPADIRDGPDSATLYIVYGRLHASNQQRFMMWNGRKCHCWHKSNMMIKFLDGLSPQEAVTKRFKSEPIREQFSELNKGHKWSNVEWAARQDSFLWKHYGNRLFDLLDLRHPELWEQYVLFVKKFYQLDPGLFNPSQPGPELIC